MSLTHYLYSYVELIFWDMVQAKVQGANVVEVVYPYCLSWRGLKNSDL
jgi:hypothetical protein